MASEIEQAMRQICEEKGISYEAVLETIESALSAAYRKDYGNKMQNIEAEFDPSDGAVKVADVKTVVEDIPEEELEKMRERQAEIAAKREAMAASPQQIRRAEQESFESTEEDEEGVKFNPKTEVMISDAKVLKLDAAIGDVIRTDLPVPGEFGRMAAMTAKQVIMQKLREAEREIIFNEYKEQEGEVLIGTVQRREGRVILVDIGRTMGVLTPEDQIQSERYNSGDRIKVFVREVALGTRGPQITLSRTSEELVRTLFEIEIPEVTDGLVEVKVIAREAGTRSKVAVTSSDNSIDPIGACIGQRGVRIQTVIQELGGEKIDVVEWSEDPEAFIMSALAPAKITSIEFNEEEQSAIAFVAGDQLSLAIGRGGQNVRLAAKLTGWRLSVREEGGDKEKSETEGEGTAEDAAEAPADEAPAPTQDASETGDKTSEAESKTADKEGEVAPAPEPEAEDAKPASEQEEAKAEEPEAEEEASEEPEEASKEEEPTESAE